MLQENHNASLYISRETDYIWEQSSSNAKLKNAMSKNIRIIGGRVFKILTAQELRQLRGVQQRDLAAKLGVAPSVLSRFESGTNPQVTTLRDYIAALGGRLILVAEVETPLGTERHLLRMPDDFEGLVRETSERRVPELVD